MSRLRRAAGGGRRRLLPRRVRAGLALALAVGALLSLAAESPTSGQTAPPEPPGGEAVSVDPAAGEAAPVEADQDLARGRQLYVEGCSSCHGFDLRGIEGRAPSLRGVGEASADFYLRTGRMPLDDPEDQPQRTESPYAREEQLAIIEYIGSFGGPTIPEVHAELGDLSEGLRLFTDNCAGCHQVVGQGGITTRAVVPDLQVSEPVDVAEAITVGPYVMPKFASQLSGSEVDSLARYVQYTQDPEDRGGWGIGHIGPIPEGMVAWLLAGAALLLTIRLIGERTTE